MAKQKGGFSQRQAATAANRQTAAQKAAALRTLVVGGMVIVFVVLLAVFVNNWSARQGEEPVAAVGTQAAETAGEGGEPVAMPTPPVTRDPDGTWTIVEGPRSLSQLEPVSRAGFYTQLPPTIVDPERDYEVIIETSKGPMRFRLFADQAPVTVNNFVSLALDGYYDGTTFHRVIEGFMAQAGDPTGTGTGGPGYQFQDEIVPSLTFDERGLLAMANAGPGTNGSQFFITFGPTTHLNGAHTIFGEIVAGQEVLDLLRLRDPMSDPEPGDEILWIYVLESN
jgi:cyclophilin family peptidyl-prolyl cis-trans isomerase